MAGNPFDELGFLYELSEKEGETGKTFSDFLHAVFKGEVEIESD